MSGLRFGSCFSGVEAASQAWEPLGWKARWFSEISPFPSAVLKYRYPEVPNYGDVTTLEPRLTGEDRHIDLLVGGSPCQSFSIAGLRGGLDDARGQLALKFFQLAGALQPRWILWENVPGVLSKNRGRDFGTILGALAELGYGFAYRVLDARYYGVPQRRRRVFVVAHLGDWRPAAAVLFESSSLRRHPKKGGQAGQNLAGTLGGGSGGRGWAPDTDRMTFIPEVVGTLCANGKAAGSATQQDAESGLIIVPEVAKFLTTRSQRIDYETETFVAFDPTQITSKTNRSVPRGDVAPTLARGARPPHLAFNARQDPIVYGDVSGPLDTDGGSIGVCVTGEQTHALRSVGADASEDGTGRGTPIVPMHARTLLAGGNLKMDESLDTYVAPSGQRVRRLTPRECERLQGMADEWTLVPTKVSKKGKVKWATDSQRYAAVGNSMAVPVMREIGRRIEKVDRLLKERK